jgi:ankyrin repeat protein
MEQLFDQAKPHFSTWVWIYDIDHRFREIMYEPRPTPPDAVPLYYATLCGFRDLIKHLIVTYPDDVNARAGVNVTPLHAAVVKGKVDVMVLLLEHGADVAAFNLAGFTPLHEASKRGRLDMISLLLGHHADVDSQDPRVGLRYPGLIRGELEIARELLRHGAAVDISNNYGFTALISISKWTFGYRSFVTPEWRKCGLPL